MITRAAQAALYALALALCATALNAGAEHAQDVGREVATEYFSLRLPAGWEEPLPVRPKNGGAVSAAFVHANGEPALTLNVIPAPFNAKQLAEMMAKDMEKNGLRPGPINKQGNLWRMTIEGRANGIGWFGSNGKICAATMIFGKNREYANALLASLRSADRDIFPEKAD